MNSTPQKIHLTHGQVMGMIAALATFINAHRKEGQMSRIYPVPRGGVPVAYMLAGQLDGGAQLVDRPEDATLIVDDLIDSGATRRRYPANVPFYALLSKGPTENAFVAQQFPSSAWLVFPWEVSVEASAEDIVTRLLQFIGEDPDREGLRETPARVLKAWDEWTAGYRQDPIAVLKTFEDGAEKVDEMILVRDIPLWSHCEHHLAPFFGVAHIGYIPNGRIVGLSKLARLVDVFGRRLQVQERLTNQIADAIDSVLTPKGVGVVIEARHMCMESRGIRRTGAVTVTSAMRGALLEKPEARAEFFAIVNRSKP